MNITIKIVFTLFIIINVYTQFAISNKFVVLRGDQIKLSTSSNRNILSRTFLCITDNPNDAITWITPLNMTVLSQFHVFNENLQDSSPFKNIDGQCGIDIESPACFSKWTKLHRNWNSTHSFKVPMNSVYDSRWENFTEYSSNYRFKRVENCINGSGCNYTFDKSGALAFSIRGKHPANLLLCESPNYTSNFCYWFSVNSGGFSLKRCKNGVGIEVMPTDVGCATLGEDSYKYSQGLNEYKWQTYLLNWEENGRFLQVFNESNDLILSYRDPYFPHNSTNFKAYHIFYQSSNETLFRFHNYSYISTKQLGATLRSPPLKIINSKGICVDMMVGLCETCALIVNLRDNFENLLMKYEITKSPMSADFRPNILSLWQHKRIIISNNTNYVSPITFDFIASLTDLPENSSRHWAITRLKECLPTETVKKISMTINQNLATHRYWPLVKCQLLSNNLPDSRIVDSTLPVTKPEHDLPLCSNFTIGPNCAISCEQYFANDCLSVAICEPDISYCAQGYKGTNCNHACSLGSYGYGCSYRCPNCHKKEWNRPLNTTHRCNSYTGACESDD